jgi:uncharacterized protein (DUF2147 family)
MPADRKLASIAVALLLPAAAAHAAGDPTGVWINDTGRGAVEIKNCGGSLCGHVVWVKDLTDTKGCGRQIIGNAAKVGNGVWDNGWIYSPEKKQKYDVELKPLSNGTLQVTGYAGTKFFSKKMIWRRAPSDLVRCGTEQTVAKADPAAKPATVAKPDSKAAAKSASPKPAKNETAKAEPKIVAPSPKPAERPAAKPDAVTPPATPNPIDVARAELESLPSMTSVPASPASTTEAAGTPPASEATPAPAPGAQGTPAGETSADAADTVPDEAADAPPSKFDMGKIAKRLAEIERETGYGLKKTANGNCRLKVPFATVNFPCKDEAAAASSAR